MWGPGPTLNYLSLKYLSRTIVSFCSMLGLDFTCAIFTKIDNVGAAIAVTGYYEKLAAPK